MGGRDRLEQIQVLRGLAALCVFVFHLGVTLDRFTPADLRQFVQWGNVGVDLFFVISGFVMAHSVRNLSGPSAAAAFLASRFWRIAPLLYVLTLVLLSTAIARGQSYDLARIVNGLTIYPVMTAPHAYQYALIPVWTLGYEFAFYAVVAAVVALGVRPRLVAIAALVCASPFLVGIGPLADSLMIEFAFGVAAYGLWRHWGIAPGMLWPALGVAALLFAWPLGESRFLAFGAPCAFLFVAALAWRPRGEAAKAGSWLGSISYSMYLSHTITFGLMTPAAALLPLPIAAALLAGGGILMSWLIHEAAEAPLQRVRFRAAPETAPQLAA